MQLKRCVTSYYAILMLNFWLSAQNEPFNFTHLIFISRVYKLTADEEAAMASAHQQSGKESKRQRYGQNPSGATAESNAAGVYSFHPEDEEIRKVCTSIQRGFENDFTCFLVCFSSSYFSVLECPAA